MKESLMMLWNFLKSPKQTGSIVQSSRFLTGEMLKNADMKKSKCIVELGPGIGTFTRHILKKAMPDAKVICFEVNKKFCRHLESNFHDRRIIIVNGRAENIRSSLKKLRIKKADCIISGLPFRNFSDADKKKIISEVKNSLSENGRFILFQYTASLGSILKENFGTVKRRLVLLNIPPAFVYTCEI